MTEETTTMALSTCLLAVFLLTTVTHAVNPGARVRVSQFGLTYLGNEALKQLAEQVKDTPIPDQSGEDHTDIGKVKWTLKNMVVRSFTAGTSKVAVTPNESVGLSVQNMGIAIHGEFHYEIKVLIPIKDSGSFDVTMSQITASTQVAFGLKQDGHLTIMMTGCTSDIGSAKVKFHGGASSIYNFFSDKISDYLKGVFNPEICKALNDVINVNGNKALEGQKLNVTLGSDMMLDMMYVSSPIIGSSFVQADIKGEVFWEPKRTPSPQVAPPLPEGADDTKMVNIWLSSYVFNTLGQIAHDHQLINTTVNREQLPDDKKYVLNTTCPSKVCIGSAITKLSSVFPDSSVIIQLTTMSVPYVSITNDSFLFTFDLRMRFDVMLPNTSRAHAFTIESVISFKLQPVMIDGNITAQISNASATAHQLDSSIGNLTDAQLSKAMSLLLDVAIIPAANAALTQVGIPLVDGEITLANPRFVMKKDAIVINTDIIYKPKSSPPSMKTHSKTSSKWKKSELNDVLKPNLLQL